MIQHPQKQENVKLASRLAWEAYLAQCGPRRAQGQISVQFLNDTYLVAPADRKITGRDGQPASDRLCTLLLHYLVRREACRTGIERAGKEIGFAQMPGASFYEGPFRKRIVSRIIAGFGNQPELFLKCGMDLGGRKVPYGDAALRFELFPGAPATLVIWRGDDEFAATANFVFDSSVAEYLSVEDVVVACEELVNRLAKAAAALR